MNVTIPNFQLPFEIPQMIHPLFVHFAIALPIIWLLLEFINLFAKRKLLSGITLFFALLNVVVFFGAYLTGVTDAKLANVNIPTLLEHKTLGIYLVYGSVAVLFLKLLSVAVSKTQMRILFILSLMVFIAVTFLEGKKGGELVYKYGVNVKAVSKPTPATQPKPEATTHQEKVTPKETPKEEANTTKEETPKAEVKLLPHKPTQTKEETNDKKEENTTHVAPTLPEKNTTTPTKEPSNAEASSEINHTQESEVNHTMVKENKELKEENSSKVPTETNTTH